MRKQFSLLAWMVALAALLGRAEVLQADRELAGALLEEVDARAEAAAARAELELAVGEPL